MLNLLSQKYVRSHRKDLEFTYDLFSRRSCTRNEGAVFAIERAMEIEPNLKVTLPNIVDENLFQNKLFFIDIIKKPCEIAGFPYYMVFY